MTHVAILHFLSPEPRKAFEMETEKVRLTVALPSSLAEHLRQKAIDNDRPLSREIVRALKLGSGWKKDGEAA